MNHILASQGSPTWLPNGFKIRKILQDYFYQKELEYDHHHVLTPVLGSKELYIQSGHWDNYQENMFPVMKRDGEEMVLRPMTCPHHMLIYKSKRRFLSRITFTNCWKCYSSPLWSFWCFKRTGKSKSNVSNRYPHFCYS